VGKPDRVIADVGFRIAECRRVRGLTQEQLATKLGVTQRYVARLEAGANVTIRTLVEVAAVLVIEVGALFQPPASRERSGPGRPTRNPRS
jgi:transcriptional regulator with XRE-family HTH domain